MTLPEGIVADVGDAFWQGDGGEARAIVEDIAIDGGQSFWQGDAFKAIAALERLFTDACYGGNYNSLEIISLPCFE
ncbi:MAG: hypothetical protein IJ539_07170 [Prevotella sp.]|nr:hypothetical protein [Prevotella sp.]